MQSRAGSFSMSAPVSVTTFVDCTQSSAPSSHRYSRIQVTPRSSGRTRTRAATLSPARGATGVPTSVPSQANIMPSRLARTTSKAPA